MTYGQRTICASTLKIQPRIHVEPVNPRGVVQEWRALTISLFLCSDMLKQPIYDAFLGLICFYVQTCLNNPYMMRF